MRYIFSVLFLAAASFSCVSNAQTLVTERTLSFSAAREAATAAMEQCRADGYKVTVTVLNRSGRTSIVLHDDDTNPHTIENSLRKAWTALTYRKPSGDVGKRIVSEPTSVGLLNLDKITTQAGGLPIMAGKQLVGSIGISGSPASDKDAACAQAGIDKIASGLNAK